MAEVPTELESASKRAPKQVWSQDEDEALQAWLDSNYGTAPKVNEVNWKDAAANLSTRTAKQVRERYTNVLDPSIRKGTWTRSEVELLFKAMDQVGRRWARIANLLPGRPETAVKNFYYSAERRAKRASKRTGAPYTAAEIKQVALDHMSTPDTDPGAGQALAQFLHAHSSQSELRLMVPAAAAAAAAAAATDSAPSAGAAAIASQAEAAAAAAAAGLAPESESKRLRQPDGASAAASAGVSGLPFDVSSMLALGLGGLGAPGHVPNSIPSVIPLPIAIDGIAALPSLPESMTLPGFTSAPTPAQPADGGAAAASAEAGAVADARDLSVPVLPDKPVPSDGDPDLADDKGVVTGTLTDTSGRTIRKVRTSRRIQVAIPAMVRGRQIYMLAVLDPAKSEIIPIQADSDHDATMKVATAAMRTTNQRAAEDAASRGRSISVGAQLGPLRTAAAGVVGQKRTRQGAAFARGARGMSTASMELVASEPQTSVVMDAGGVGGLPSAAAPEELLANAEQSAAAAAAAAVVAASAGAPTA